MMIFDILSLYTLEKKLNFVYMKSGFDLSQVKTNADLPTILDCAESFRIWDPISVILHGTAKFCIPRFTYFGADHSIFEIECMSGPDDSSFAPQIPHFRSGHSSFEW